MKKNLLITLLMLLGFFANGQSRSEHLKQLFDTLYAKHQFNGCVLITDSRRPIFKSAYGYADLDKKTALNLETRFGVNGAYGISSTVEDLLKWDQALYTQQLVSSATMKEAFTPQQLKDGSYAGFEESMPYGFGWILTTDTSENTFVWHTGSWAGYSSLLTRYTKRRLTVIVLQNIGNDISPNALMEPVSQILDNEQNYDLPEVPALKKSIVVTSAQLKPCVGTSQVNGDSSRKMVISSRQNHLYAKYMEQVPANIYPSSAETFFIRW